jgi:shikimate kinase
LESHVVADLCASEGTVVALGGGAVLREENRQALTGCQAVAWLQGTAETLSQRIAQDPVTAARRPNLTNHDGRTEIEVLLAQREPFYRTCATLEVDTEHKEPADIAGEIFAAVNAAG